MGAPSRPFLLRRVAELSGGGFLAVDAALVKNSAAVAGRLAVAYAPARRRAAGAGAGVPARSSVAQSLALAVGVPAGMVTGAAAVDACAGFGIGAGGGGCGGEGCTPRPPSSLLAHLNAVRLSPAGLVPVLDGRPPTYFAFHDGARGELVVGVVDIALPAILLQDRAPPPVATALATATVLVAEPIVGADHTAAAVAATDPAAHDATATRAVVAARP